MDEAVLTVPWYRGRLERLPAPRYAAFQRHLRRIICEALGETGPSSPKRATPEISPAVLAVAADACATCGGHCCARGGDHAYLDDDTIRHVMRTHPQLRARGLMALYRDRLPEKSFAGSCVFHGAAGCVLPRELRSDLCNSFYCNGLRRFLRDHSGLPVAQVRIEAAEGETIREITRFQPPPES